jgi:cobalt-zinc-cadmium efflux system outer membrane protein
MEIERARRDLEANRVRLAGSWGNAKPLFKSVEGDLEALSPIPTLDRLTAHLSKNPELARWTTEISQRRAQIALEESKAVPNITVSGGYLTSGTVSNSPAFVAGLSIPLPIFDKNQGNIQEARHRLSKGEEEKKAAETRVNNLLSQAYRAVSTAYAESATLKSKILPRTQSTFDAINEGYRLGKFSLMDVLDAQRTIFDAKTRYLQAMTAYHKAVAEIEQIIGERLDSVPMIKNDKGS